MPGRRRRSSSPSDARSHPGGAVAGILDRTPVHLPPTGQVAGTTGVVETVGQAESENLSRQGVNLLRSVSVGEVRVRGARTTSTGDDWRYVNVRRLFIFLEHSLEQSTQWVVFEPNGEALWSSVRDLVVDFLHAQWRNRALPGSRPEEAFFVRCDRTTMTQDYLDRGRLIFLIGIAPVRPSEFVIFRIGQWTDGRRPFD